MDHETCHTLLASLSEFADGSLSDDLCAQIQRHLDDCQNCRIVVDSLRKTILLVQQTSAEEAACPEQVRERLYLRLELDDLLKPRS
jgi:anti-sigma factor (TIGR02949 family)